MLSVFLDSECPSTISSHKALLSPRLG